MADRPKRRRQDVQILREGTSTALKNSWLPVYHNMRSNMIRMVSRIADAADFPCSSASHGGWQYRTRVSMKRRELLLVIGGALTVPVSGRAQTVVPARIGIL